MAPNEKMQAISEIYNSHGERLDHTFHPGAAGNTELVVIGHGVTANKDRPFLLALSEALAGVGIASLRVSFAGNGASQGRFEAATISKEVADLGCVLDALPGWQVRYAGHSMGGAVGVLRAAEDPRIEKLVSLAGMVRTANFVERKFAELTPGQDFMWDKPDCPLSQAYVDDLRRIDTVLAQAGRIAVPWLLVHGDDDEVVLPKDSEDAQQAAPDRTELVRLAGADHVFSGDATAAMCATVANWLQTP